MIPSELRQRYFGVNFTLLNLGIGIGGLVGGRGRATSTTSATFQPIYLGDAVSYLPALFLMLVPAAPRRRAGSSTTTTAPAAKVGYLDVVRRPGGRLDAGAELRVVVRRLLAAQRRHAGVRPLGRRDLDAGARASRSPPTRW